MTTKQENELFDTIKLMSQSITRQDKILERLDTVINGNDEIGVIGLRQRQENDDIAKQEFLTELKSIHSDVDTIMNWKDGIQTSTKKLTSWRFWSGVFIVVGVSYTLITKGLPDAWDFIIKFLKL